MVKEIKSSAIIEQQAVVISPSGEMEEEPLSLEYRVGSGDVLAISIPGITGLSFVKGEKKLLQRFRVSRTGKINLPVVGFTKVAGHTIDEIEERLCETFSPYIRKPAVSIEVIEFKSQTLYLLGKFNQPGVYYLERPISLVQCIAMGAGLQDSANLRGARLIRKNKIVPVDIYNLLHNNDARQNIHLMGDDIIYLPGSERQNVFIFGAVKKEGPISMINGRLSLIQALSVVGIGGESGTYDSQHFRIIRSHSPTRGELMVVDLGKIMSGNALPLSLQDGDIIYVPRSGIGNWNQALKEILPTLQTFSARLQPFVQLKYLMEED
ncbi:MAG: sugar transporter [Desulfobacteraceae bacterium]|nr:sugar transporter [Desulfobacteraceae bacterium]MBC2720977.1 polysaccharide biosynthesis/export family protein [Desulfobacteraceae bacterium]